MDAFDEEEFREKVRYFRRKLKEAKQENKVHLAERQFEFLERAQLRIPLALDRLNTLCRSVWVDMIECYVECGQYAQLKRFLDKFERVYELHASDRALFTLRHFVAQDLTTMALDFWKDADREGILDERSYSDCITWFALKPELETETREILQSALTRAKTGMPRLASGAPFVLTVHYYNAAMRFYILNGDLEQLKTTCEQLVAEAPYGLGATVFAAWLADINELVWKPSVRAHYCVSPATKLNSSVRTTSESRMTFDLEKLLALHKTMFDMVLGTAESCGFSILGGIRVEQLRCQLLHTSEESQQIESINLHMASHSSEALDALIDSFILRNDIENVRRLLESSTHLFGSEVSPSASTFELISKRLRRILNNPTLYPEISNSSEQTALVVSSIKKALSPSFTCLIPLIETSKLNHWQSVVLGLFQTAFMRPNSQTSHAAHAPLNLTGRVFSMLLDIITKAGSKDARAKLRPAVVAVLEWLMSKSSLNLPNDSDGPYNLLKQLHALDFEQEAVDFLHYCSHRLDIVPFAGLLHLRMIHLEPRKDYTGIRNLWNFAVERQLMNHAKLLDTYIQILSRQDTDLKERENAIASFVASAVNDQIRASPKLCYELNQIFFNLDDHLFDVPAFWALEKWRRRWRVPLTSNIASLIATIMTQRGDKYIKSEACVRLHADFESYINTSIYERHEFEPLDLHDVTLFEDAFDRWHGMFLASTPAQSRFISPLFKDSNESSRTTNSRKAPIKQRLTL